MNFKTFALPAKLQEQFRIELDFSRVWKRQHRLACAAREHLKTALFSSKTKTTQQPKVFFNLHFKSFSARAIKHFSSFGRREFGLGVDFTGIKFESCSISPKALKELTSVCVPGTLQCSPLKLDLRHFDQVSKAEKLVKLLHQAHQKGITIDLSDVKIDQHFLRWANIYGLPLRGAKLENIEFDANKYPNIKDFRGAEFKNCSLTGNFNDCDFSGTKIDSTFNFVWFSHCQFKGLNPSRIHMVAAHFSDCHFQDSRIRFNEDLSESGFTNCTLLRTDLTDSKLNLTQFIETSFNHCTLSGVKLKESENRSFPLMKNIVFVLCNLTGFDIDLTCKPNNHPVFKSCFTKQDGKPQAFNPNPILPPPQEFSAPAGWNPAVSMTTGDNLRQSQQEHQVNPKGGFSGLSADHLVSC